MIDLDELLHGTPTWQEVAEFFRNGEFCDEPYLVEAIEKHLITTHQRLSMFQRNLTIEKILNGRFGRDDILLVEQIFHEWNAKLRFHHFGF